MKLNFGSYEHLKREIAGCQKAMLILQVLGVNKLMKVKPNKVTYSFCINCKKDVKFKIDWMGVKENTPKGIITYKELYAVCPHCGEEIYIPAVNDVNVYRREKAFAEKVPEPVQIPIAAGELARRIEEQLKMKPSEETERGKEILKEMFEGREQNG